MSHPVIVREETSNGIQQFDVYSRLFEDRILMIDSEFEPYMCSLVCSQLLMLSNKSPEPISIYLNSPGGSVSHGLAILDVMGMIPNVIKTVAIGQACSMGAFILSAGTKGHRFASPNSRIMLHQLSSGMHRSVFKDIQVSFEETKRTQETLNKLLALHCGKTVAQIEKATERDFWMSPEEAVKFGLIDKVMEFDKNSWKLPKK